ncbi:MAG: ATP-dependent nuclease [Microbacteriaceae bacterium]
MTDFESLESFLDAKICEPFIRSIRFPRFKNLSSGTRIDFEYPITALVGPNGTNKSSILRALEACPENRDISDHWFDTPLDNIQTDETAKNVGRYIHAYQTPSGLLAEVIKMRVWKESRGEDYFETAKPRLRDGMQPMPDNVDPSDKLLRGKTRWRPIDKNVVYLDFRQELPAYDIFMSFNWSQKDNTAGAKKKKVRQRSSHVKAALFELRPEHEFYGKNRILEPAEMLTDDELAAVGKILDRKYKSIRLVKHNYFGVEGYTASLETDRRTYSEAYAGSGEFAAVMLVKAISRASAKSLILLDEPETSLHPAAQRELMKFVAEKCVEHNHQVVLATHAPAIITDLPNKAIKLVDINPVTGSVDVVAQEASPAEAFIRIGADYAPRTIVVEDSLAMEFVLRVARSKGDDFLNSIRVIPIPGGVEKLKRLVAPVQAQLGSEAILLMDGDQRPEIPLRPPSSVAPAELATELMKLNINDGVLLRDGGSGDPEAQLAKARETTYEWVFNHVGYLPTQLSPDALLMELLSETCAPKDAKRKWVEKTHSALGYSSTESVSAEDILNQQKQALATIDPSHPQLIELRQEVERLLGEF